MPASFCTAITSDDRKASLNCPTRQGEKPCGFMVLAESVIGTRLHGGAGGKSRPVVTAPGRGAVQEAPLSESRQLDYGGR